MSTELGKGSTEKLLEALVATATRRFEDARAAPSGIYVDPGMLALEKRNLLQSEWMCVGRAQDYPALGSYQCHQIGGEPIIVLRDEDDRLRAFSNICRHRGARLLHGVGSSKRIICPYHAWTYSLDGNCVATPFIAKTDATSLPEFVVECWEGWVYVTLDAHAASLGPRLAPVADRLRNYRMDKYEPLFRAHEVWDANWKLLIENAIDPYHLFRAHAKTVEPSLPTRLAECLPGEAGFSWFLQRRVPGVAFQGGPEVDVDRLSDDERRSVPFVCVFPTHVISVSCDRLFWFCVQPVDEAHTEVLWGLDVYPGAFPGGSADPLAENLVSSCREINAEDKGILRGLQDNAGCIHGARGQLCHLERSVWEFHRYLLSRLAGEERASANHHDYGECPAHASK